MNNDEKIAKPAVESGVDRDALDEQLRLDYGRYLEVVSEADDSMAKGARKMVLGWNETVSVVDSSARPAAEKTSSLSWSDEYRRNIEIVGGGVDQIVQGIEYRKGSGRLRGECDALLEQLKQAKDPSDLQQAILSLGNLLEMGKLDFSEDARKIGVSVENATGELGLKTLRYNLQMAWFGLNHIDETTGQSNEWKNFVGTFESCSDTVVEQGRECLNDIQSQEREIDYTADTCRNSLATYFNEVLRDIMKHVE